MTLTKTQKRRAQRQKAKLLAGDVQIPPMYNLFDGQSSIVVGFDELNVNRIKAVKTIFSTYITDSVEFFNMKDVWFNTYGFNCSEDTVGFDRGFFHGERQCFAGKCFSRFFKMPITVDGVTIKLASRQTMLKSKSELISLLAKYLRKVYEDETVVSEILHAFHFAYVEKA